MPKVFKEAHDLVAAENSAAVQYTIWMADMSNWAAGLADGAGPRALFVTAWAVCYNR